MSVGGRYENCEFTEEATVRKFRVVQHEGKRDVSRDANHYNLQMIIAVVVQGQ